MIATLVLTLWSAPALADCDLVYDATSLGNDLGAMAAGQRELDPTAFHVSGQRLMTGLPCVNAPMAPVVLARAYRAISLHLFLKGDINDSRRWMRTALELDSSYEWDVREVSLDHPIRAAFNDEREQADVEPTPIEGREISVPPGMRITLDGRALTSAAATVDRPHLLQVMTTQDGAITAVHLIEGNAIPERYLTSAGSAPVVATAEPADYSVEVIERNRPPAKTPLLIGGALGVVSGIGLYSASFFTYKQYKAASTTQDMNELRDLNNLLVMAAAGSFVAGAGMGYFGVILGAHPGMTWMVRF
jgi:hypothetical protein